MTAEISFYQTSLDPSIDAKNKSASTSFTSEEGISVISEKMQNTNIENNGMQSSLQNSLQNNENSIQNNNNTEIKTQMMMSASSSEMLDKSTEEMSDEKIGAVSSSSFEESSDSEDKKSTTSGASSDLSSDNKAEVGGVQFGTQWMDQTSSSNEESDDHQPSQFNLMVSRSVNRSDSAVSKSSGKSTDSRNSVESRNSIESRTSELRTSESRPSESHSLKTKSPLESRKSIDSNVSKNSSSSINYAPQKVSNSSPRDSVFSNYSTGGGQPKISDREQKKLTVPNPIKSSDLSEQDLSLYNEYTQILRQMRRRRESDMKRARRTLEESQWLLDLLWKATNVQKTHSRHSSITSELETVQEGLEQQLEQARLNNIQAFLGKQQNSLKSTEIKRKSSFKKTQNNDGTGKKVVVFNRKIAVSQPSVVTNFQVVQNDSAEVPKNLKLKSKIAPRPPSFSTSSLDTKYKVSGGLNPPKTEQTALLIGKIIETAVKIDEKEAALNNTPRRLANNDRLIIKLKIMLSKKWSKDGEIVTWTRVDDGAAYDV